jgi:pimeloyl-ACP methyl ester carboxylesterase
MQEHLALGVGPDRIDIAFARYGSPSNPALLMIMGLGAQLVSWPCGFLDALVVRGLQPVVFDNRDSGRSTHLRDAPAADVAAALAGDLSTAAYTLSAMAADAVGLLDHLGIDAAHVLGASLGGAIAQTVAIEHPQRVLSLSSLMSTTGDPSVGQIHPETAAAVFNGPPASSRRDVVERALRTFGAVGSPAYPTDPADVIARAGRAPVGYGRSTSRLWSSTGWLTPWSTPVAVVPLPPPCRARNSSSSTVWATTSPPGCGT